ncbi:NADH-quinone oxidoreductase subunit J [Rickettsia endosymbiont of Cardiosporidium cionae]|uniref:NADH-quinone oxidoreductase subunit J n=1 Tax=Rickettsia endosymbiont of Cardiosporidium cionae TaxID=2777155 RepID=UPI001E33AD8D|nr:NADH-quinone oxidoreductase subunit J [Rickettsia endosymbiont of Cardiosporidium cionae]
MVVISDNSVYSIFWLIFTFCNAAVLLILIGAEFIALILIIVYVGAIAILFLFVVMMMDIKFTKIKNNVFDSDYMISLVVLLFLFIDLLLILKLGYQSITIKQDSIFSIDTNHSNIFNIAKFLYTNFLLEFQTIGIILLVAMISVIYLTYISKSSRVQNVKNQLSRTKESSIQYINPKQSRGIDDIKYD